MRSLIIPLALVLTSCVSTSTGVSTKPADATTTAAQTAAPATAPAAPVPAAPAPAVAAGAQPCRPEDTTINATLWMQTAAEYEAITREVFAAAAQNLDAALKDGTWQAITETVPPAVSKPPAIIMDIDETVLDTSGNQARLIKTGTGFTEEEWHNYAMHDESLPIRAAVDFIEAVQQRGVAVFFITNRLASEEPALRATLAKHGFPLPTEYDNVLTRGERDEWMSSDKSPRRAFVGTNYRVIMMFGDDLNDFIPATEKSLFDRHRAITQFGQWLGHRWFFLPNPVYGSWERIVLGDTQGLTDCQQVQRKIEAVRQ